MLKKSAFTEFFNTPERFVGMSDVGQTNRAGYRLLCSFQLDRTFRCAAEQTIMLPILKP